ncbi:MAG: gliding motility-associated C-terminal domain-containing protein, partial [Flavobacteriales bacterium]|nr:gliding motility-associated C-terminal domain-containing protein [Flavobacteriales bacterium]
PLIANPTASPDESITYTVSMISVEGCEVSLEQEVTVFDNNPGGEVYPTEVICIGNSIQLSAADGFQWVWSPDESLNNGSVQNPTASPNTTTTYQVVVTNICGSGTDQVTVEVIEPEAIAMDDGVICFGENHPVSASGGILYQWIPEAYATNPDEANTFVSPPSSQAMTVVVTDENGCVDSDEVFIEVLPLPDVEAGPNVAVTWLEPTQLFGDAQGEYWWTPEEFLDCSDCLSPIALVEAPQWFVLHEVDENGCVGKDSTFVDIYFPIYVPNTFTPNGDGINDVFMAYGEGIRGFHMEIHNRWGELIYESDDITQPWLGNVHNGEHFAQDDVYIWTLWYDDLEGRQELQGHVTLLR